MIACPDCQSTHMGTRCGMTFAQRIGTVVIDQTQLETREQKKYWDQEALDAQLGADAEDQVMEETKGLGATMEDGRGGLWRRDRHSKEIVPVTQEDIDKVYLGGEDHEPDPAETEVA